MFGVFKDLFTHDALGEEGGLQRRQVARVSCLISDYAMELREGTEHEKNVLLAGYRRVLSTTAAKANSTCLLDRVAMVEEGHRQAA